jgi:cytochrome c556
MKAARFLLIGAAIAIAAMTSTAAWAQDKEKVIAERQDVMKKQIRDWIAVRNYLAGNADQQAAVAAADALTKSVPTVANYFPPGTAGPAPDGKWGTKPEVWTEHDKFLAAVKKVSEQVAALDAAVKTGDKAKAEVAFKELDGCNACHNSFRAKLQ